jgi:anti-sigma B factor antagonist
MYESDSLTFRQLLDRELEKGKKWIVLETSRVAAMSSTGLGILIATHRHVTEKGGRFKLAHPSEKVRAILEITRLNRIFDIHDNVDQAVKAVKGGEKK